MKKRVFYTELAYVLGLAVLAFGTALMEKAGLGVSMVVAPAYLIYRKLSEILPFFTFGMAEYLLQAVLLLALAAVLRRFRPHYLFCVAAVLFYSLVLDGGMHLMALLPAPSLAGTLVLYVLGLFLCALGVSLLFHTYLTPEVYELVVKEIAAKWKLDINHCKTVYDCVSCGVSILLSFAFFGLWHFEGVKWGTVLYALVNGTLIGWITRFLEGRFQFRDRWPLRKYFE